MSRRPVATVGGVLMALAILVSACGSGGDGDRAERAAQLAALSSPAWVPAGAVPFEAITDGGPCGSDCPPPAVSWSYVCDCPDLAVVVAGIQRDAERAGWQVTEGGGSDGFLRARRQDASGSTVELSVLTWPDAVQMQPGSAELQRIGTGRQGIAISVGDT